MNNTNAKSGRNISLGNLAREISNFNIDEQVVLFKTQFDGNPKDIFPLYIDALMIILVRKGSGILGIDLIEHELRENTLVVLQPKNYLFLSDCSLGTEAEVLACSSNIVEDIMPKITDILPMLLQHRANPVTYLSADMAERLHKYYQFISEQLSLPMEPYTKAKVLKLMQAALYEMMNVTCHQDIDTDEIIHSRKEEIMAKFIIAVTEKFRTERRVNYYADELCISPKHLSAVVKTLSGRTASEWIDNYVTMEAKVLLKTTNATIQEISNKLNFKSQSFFGKFFKNQTGITPSEYRRQNR